MTCTTTGGTGYHQAHQEEQEKLVDDALTGRRDPSMNRRG